MEVVATAGSGCCALVPRQHEVQNVENNRPSSGFYISSFRQDSVSTFIPTSPTVDSVVFVHSGRRQAGIRQQ